MKILSRDLIRQADEFTIRNEPIASIDLMERAARAFMKIFTRHFPKSHRIHVFCGTGNNGGDGLAVSRMLLSKGYTVNTYIVHYSTNYSQDFKINLKRLKDQKKAKIIDIREADYKPPIGRKNVAIDALWGSGLTRPVSGFAAELIKKINRSVATLVALDIPSGLFCDEFNPDPVKVNANLTITLQAPKLSFFMPENQEHTGKFVSADIGISKTFITKASCRHYFTTIEDIRSILQKRKIFDHKGVYGHALLIAGSYGKIGAAVLGSTSCLRAGAGLLTTLVPGCGYDILQTAIPEAMVITSKDYTHIDTLPDLSLYDAIGIGPGIGNNATMVKTLSAFMKKNKKPVIFDADAINILSESTELLAGIPPGCILTPHIGEFERLIGKCSNHYDRLEKLREFAVAHQCIVVLKGAYTAIAGTEGKIYFNSTGNPGMATAGSGDVLTGIITSLLAQGYPALHAARTGVYLHGLAADLYVKKHSQEALIAGDITGMLSRAFRKVRQ